VILFVSHINNINEPVELVNGCIEMRDTLLSCIWVTSCIALEGIVENLLSVKEAAKQLGISKYTVEAWLSKKKMQRTKVGRRTMIRESELEKVIVDGGQSPAPSWRVQ
jgi:excisionase family DNA binding protein